MCLMVGLGVDNAFVIVQEFNNAEKSDKERGVRRSLEERIGRGLRQAGVGITGRYFMFIFNDIQIQQSLIIGMNGQIFMLQNDLPTNVHFWTIVSTRSPWMRMIPSWLIKSRSLGAFSFFTSLAS